MPSNNELAGLFGDQTAARGAHRVRGLVAVALIGAAGLTAYSEMSSPAPRPVAAVVQAHQAPRHAHRPAGPVQPKPQPKAAKKLHVLRSLMLAHRLLRVHRVFRLRMPFWRTRRIMSWWWSR